MSHAQVTFGSVIGTAVSTGHPSLARASSEALALVRPGGTMPILCYHEVDPHWESPLAVTPTAFEEHVRWLARNRVTVDLRNALGHLDRRGRLPTGMAALTFDDGFAGVLEHAAPALERWGLPATIFVVADTLSGGHEVDWVDDPPSWPLRTLDAEALRHLRDRGFRIGSHTASHRTCTELSDAELTEDLRRSRQILGDVLGGSVDLLAYPRGIHDPRVRRLAKAAGFSAAFSLPEQREPVTRFSIPRVGVYRGAGLGKLRLKASRRYLTARTHPAYGRVRSTLSR